MTAENVERARAVALNVDVVAVVAGGDEAIARTFPGLDAEVRSEFISQNPYAEAPSYTGIGGLLEGWRDWLEPWSSYRIDVREVIDTDGDDVVLLAHAEARTARDGVVVSHDPAAVLTFSGAGITRLRFFVDATDALRAVGSERRTVG